MFGFEEFFNGGGGGFQQEEESQTGQHTELYEVLGLQPDCLEKDIKKAWRKAAASHHPDRGGDVAQFQMCQKAYEILSDPEKRKMYDKYGERFLKGEVGDGPSGMEDIINQMFGGHRHGQERGPPRGKDVGVRFPVTLEELFSGADKEIDWRKRDLCGDCGGHGGPPEAKTECDSCEGRGIVVQVVRRGPFIQQQRMACPQCNGEGYRIDPTLQCQSCTGNGIVEIEKKLHFSISPGMAKGDRVKIAEEGDRVTQDMIPGDVYILLEPQEHDFFVRKGDHLVYEKKISLLESLTGFQFTLEHLDGRVLEVSSEPSKVYHPGMLRMISGEGMPTHRNPVIKGLLVIKFDVEFPESLDVSVDIYNSLSSILPTGSHIHPDFIDEKAEDGAKGKSGKKGKKKPKKKGGNRRASGPEKVFLEEVTPDVLDRVRRDSAQMEQGEDGDGAACHVQ